MEAHWTVARRGVSGRREPAVAVKLFTSRSRNHRNSRPIGDGVRQFPNARWRARHGYFFRNWPSLSESVVVDRKQRCELRHEQQGEPAVTEVIIWMRMRQGISKRPP